jgi:hypothetical protein
VFEQKLMDALQRYERRRIAGLHTGPALRGLKLVKQIYANPDPFARDIDRPTREEVIAEVLLPAAQAGR